MPGGVARENVTVDKIYEVLMAVKDDLANVKDLITSNIRANEERFSILEAENIELRKKIQYLEKKSRKNNIVVYGVEHSGETDLQECVLSCLNQKLGTNFEDRDINDIFKLGRDREDSRRPVLVEFISTLSKRKLFGSVGRLKGTGVTVVHDLPLEERRERATLRRHLREARLKNLSATIRNGALIVNGESFSVGDLADRGGGPGHIVCGSGQRDPCLFSGSTSQGGAGVKTRNVAPVLHCASKSGLNPTSLRSGKQRSDSASSVDSKKSHRSVK